jgi:hypothetical protein
MAATVISRGLVAGEPNFLARLSHLEGVRDHKSNGMSNGCTKVFTTKAELN